MRYATNSPETPVYAPNSYGGPHADASLAGDEGQWAFDGESVRAGYIEHAEDGDFTQAGTLVREVLSDDERDRLVDNIVGHALGGVSEPVLLRVFDYWKSVDPDLGKRVEIGVREGQAGN